MLACTRPPAPAASPAPARAEVDAATFNVAPAARLVDRAQLAIPLADAVRRHQLPSLIGKIYLYWPDRGGCEAPVLSGGYNILAEDAACTVSAAAASPTTVYASRVDGRLAADLSAFTGVASLSAQALLDVRIEEAGHAVLDAERPRCFRPQQMRLPRGRPPCRAVVVTGVVHYVTTVRVLDRVDAAASAGLSVLRVGAQAYRAREQRSVRHTLAATVLDITGALRGKRRLAKGEAKRFGEVSGGESDREQEALPDELVTLEEPELAEAVRARDASPLPAPYGEALRGALTR